jgi:hypothetical protein
VEIPSAIPNSEIPLVVFFVAFTRFFGLGRFGALFDIVSPTLGG